MNNQTQIINNILNNCKTIAIVGLSSNPQRPSNHVAQYLQQQGYKIIPINPSIDEVLGEPAYPSLSAAAKKHSIDLVNIFRSSEHVPAIYMEAINLGIKNIWLQLGIENDEIATIAKQQQINYIENQCIKIAHTVMQLGL